ncbi:hypothetical protein FB451DRAFT_1552432 [Mycena latifolia]|nr:hypothetical protein FB451DRAFT_1552432 [Mycena latifolia]
MRFQIPSLVVVACLLLTQGAVAAPTSADEPLSSSEADFTISLSQNPCATGGAGCAPHGHSHHMYAQLPLKLKRWRSRKFAA